MRLHRWSLPAASTRLSTRPRKSTSRATRSPRPGSPAALRLEQLEARLLMAGDLDLEPSKEDWLFRPVGGVGSAGLFSGSALTQSAQFDFHFQGAPAVESTTDGAVVSLADEQTWLAEGDPMVPFRQSAILLPQGMQITGVEVSYLDPGELIATGIGALAAPVPLPFDGGPADPDAVRSVSESFPGADPVTYSNQVLCGYNLGLLSVFPVSYDAQTGSLRFHRDLSLSITVSAAEGADQLPPSAEGWEQVATMVANPEMLQTYTPAEPQAGSPLLPPGTGYEYVIVTSQSLQSSFQPLVNQKIARGLTAGIVTSEYIYANYAGTENHDNADKIRQFIADAHTNWGTQWVLLGGDVDVIPQRGVYVSYGGYEETAMPSDLYFACLDGTWNGDGDARWGESTDGAGGRDIDLSADVYIGRAPVSNATEAANFVAKTVQYETQTHPHASTALLLGEKLDSSTLGSYSSIPIKEQTIPDGWNVIERYDTQTTETWSGSSFVADLNNSPNLVHHLGHTNWNYNAKVTNSSISSLTNAFPYFMYSQGCISGAFDYSDAIAETHVVDDHGAFAVVMNARYGWYQPGTTPGASHYYALEFFDAVFNEHLVHVGQANRDSQLDNLSRVGASGVYRWIHFETNLLGDPETPFQVDGYVPPPPEPPPPDPGSITGTVFRDDNGNGQIDAGDTGAANVTAFLDLNQNGVLDTGAAQFQSNTPVTISDLSTVNGTLTVSGLSRPITDLNITLDITHTYDGDLTVTLISPDAVRVNLFSYVGGSGDNFSDTTLDDEAGTYIGSGTAPFHGSFQPASALSAFDGAQANGVWTLEISDDAGGDVGLLTHWSLEIRCDEPSTVTNAQGAYSFTGLSAGSYRVGDVLSAGFRNVSPASGLQTVTVSTGQSATANFLVTRAGDGSNTPGLYTNGLFLLRYTNDSGGADNSFGYGLGSASSIPLVGDWNGDGVDTIGVYDSSSAVFYLRNSNDSGYAQMCFGYGASNWIPLVGDWNGDGIDTIGVMDPVHADFYLNNQNDGGMPEIMFGYGAPGWTPMAGDWNGDGIDTIGVMDPVHADFYLNHQNDGSMPEIMFGYGAPGWTPLAGDWNHDGVDSVGVYVDDSAVFYLRNSNSGGYADIAFDYGTPGAGSIPIDGNWTGTTAARLTPAEQPPAVPTGLEAGRPLVSALGGGPQAETPVAEPTKTSLSAQAVDRVDLAMLAALEIQRQRALETLSFGTVLGVRNHVRTPAEEDGLSPALPEPAALLA